MALYDVQSAQMAKNVLVIHSASSDLSPLRDLIFFPGGSPDWWTAAIELLRSGWASRPLFGKVQKSQFSKPLLILEAGKPVWLLWCMC